MENTTQQTETSQVTLNDISKLSEVIQNESLKNELNEQVQQLNEKQNSLYATIKDYDMNNNFIDEKLNNYTVDELEEKLKNDDFVNEFFVDPVTGGTLELNIDFKGDKGREQEFKRGLLVYFKSTKEAFEKIDEEFAKLDKATEEFNMDIAEATKVLSDNVLSYISALTDKANQLDDEKMKQKLLTTVKYIRSGYDMSIFSDVLDTYPSIAKKCPLELSNPADIARIGQRYSAKLKSNKVKASLIAFTSDITSNKKSFEELMLIRNDEYIMPDLFVYSMIRYFAITPWNDNVKRAHATICLVLKKLINNELADEVKKDVLTSIVAYLKKFKIN